MGGNISHNGNDTAIMHIGAMIIMGAIVLSKAMIPKGAIILMVAMVLMGQECP